MNSVAGSFNGVSTQPGHTQLARMLSGASSAAKALGNAMISPLEAEYAVMPGPPLRPASEETFTMEPPPLSLRYGTPYLAPKKHDLGLTRISRSHSDSSKSVIAPERWAPALLTMMSIPPIFSAAVSINVRMSSASDTSVLTNRASPLASSMSATVL